jgi:hypothetical protein
LCAIEREKDPGGVVDHLFSGGREVATPFNSITRESLGEGPVGIFATRRGYELEVKVLENFLIPT